PDRDHARGDTGRDHAPLGAEADGHDRLDHAGRHAAQPPGARPRGTELPYREGVRRRAPALRAHGQAHGRPARRAGGGSAQVSTDLLGRSPSSDEERLLGVYEELKSLARADLPPNAHANVLAALALMHNVVSGLALRYEHLSDLGV